MCENFIKVEDSENNGATFIDPSAVVGFNIEQIGGKSPDFYVTLYTMGGRDFMLSSNKEYGGYTTKDDAEEAVEKFFASNVVVEEELQMPELGDVLKIYDDLRVVVSRHAEDTGLGNDYVMTYSLKGIDIQRRYSLKSLARFENIGQLKPEWISDSAKVYCMDNTVHEPHWWYNDVYQKSAGYRYCIGKEVH